MKKVLYIVPNVSTDPVAKTCSFKSRRENEEDFQTEIWSFAYPLEKPLLNEDGTVQRDEIVVATTRPETMLGDTTGSTPRRPRYKALIGSNVRHPFQDRLIPIVADAELVDPDRNRCRKNHTSTRF